MHPELIRQIEQLGPVLGRGGGRPPIRQDDGSTDDYHGSPDHYRGCNYDCASHHDRSSHDHCCANDDGTNDYRCSDDDDNHGGS